MSRNKYAAADDAVNRIKDGDIVAGSSRRRSPLELEFARYSNPASLGLRVPGLIDGSSASAPSSQTPIAARLGVRHAQADV